MSWKTELMGEDEVMSRMGWLAFGRCRERSLVRCEGESLRSPGSYLVREGFRAALSFQPFLEANLLLLSEVFFSRLPKLSFPCLLFC